MALPNEVTTEREAEARAAGVVEPVRIRVDYDFASTVCYVAHRTMRRIQPALGAVTGVPNFMPGQWPFGGIQTDETMLSLFERFIAKQRREASA